MERTGYDNAVGDIVEWKWLVQGLVAGRVMIFPVLPYKQVG